MELIGAPGVGKSTVGALVAEQLGVPFHSTRGETARPWSNRVMAVASRPRLALSVATAIGGKQGISEAFNLARRDRWLRRTGPGVRDGGPLHVACMAAASQPAARRLVPLVTRSRVVVFLACEPDLIVTRLLGRDDGWHGLEEAEIAGWVARYQQLASEVAGLRVDASGPPDRTAGSIIDLLPAAAPPGDG